MDQPEHLPELLALREQPVELVEQQTLLLVPQLKDDVAELRSEPDCSCCEWELRLACAVLWLPVARLTCPLESVLPARRPRPRRRERTPLLLVQPWEFPEELE